MNAGDIRVGGQVAALTAATVLGGASLGVAGGVAGGSLPDGLALATGPAAALTVVLVWWIFDWSPCEACGRVLPTERYDFREPPAGWAEGERVWRELCARDRGRVRQAEFWAAVEERVELDQQGDSHYEREWGDRL